MGKRTEKEADKWVGVNDARKRKQIQDRLAQRARRKHLSQYCTKSHKLQAYTLQASELRKGKQNPELSIDQARR